MRLGAHGWRLPDGASVNDLRLYAATMRRLYEIGTSQARRAMDRVNAIEHRAAQATQDTSEIDPAIIEQAQTAWTLDGPPADGDQDETASRWIGHGGELWDLTRRYADSNRHTWRWAGGYENLDGVGYLPLMSRDDHDRQHRDVVLDAVIAAYGPLTPIDEEPVEDLTAPGVIDSRPEVVAPTEPCDECETSGRNCAAHGGRPGTSHPAAPAIAVAWSEDVAIRAWGTAAHTSPVSAVLLERVVSGLQALDSGEGDRG
jgi:hypothetical protein